jgi:hypothetical protein
MCTHYLYHIHSPIHPLPGRTCFLVFDFVEEKT